MMSVRISCVSLVITLAALGGNAFATTWEGDYYIDTPEDLQALAGVDEITGQLYVNLGGEVTIPDLVVLGGSLHVNYAETSLLAAENLTSIGESFQITSSDISQVTLPLLQQVGTLLNLSGTQALEICSFPQLHSVGEVGVSNNAALLLWSAPELRQVNVGYFYVAGNSLLTRVDAAKLRGVADYFYVQDNPALALLRVPRLDYVYGAYGYVDGNAFHYECSILEHLIELPSDYVYLDGVMCYDNRE
jgi:hypothetical protein